MPEEPDRYDFEEMMERLNSRRASGTQDEGELVTREDGSQAIRVRKRKRRSRQPQRDGQKRMRMLQVSALLIVVVLLILAAGFVTIYVNTAPFRKQLTQRVTTSTGAQSELKQFRMNPVGANAQGIDMEWPAGNVLGSLSLRLLQTDVSLFSVLSGNFSGDTLSVQSGKLILRRCDPSKPRRVLSDAGKDGALHFEQCNITNLQIQFDGKQPGVFRLQDSEATFKPASKEQRALLRMTRGDLRSHHWPLLELDRAYIEFDDDVVDIIGASFRHPDDERGQIELAGKASPYDHENPSLLGFRAQSFLLSGLIGDSLGKIIEGRIDTDADAAKAELVLPFDGQTGMKLNADFSSTEDEALVLENLPVLFALSQILGDESLSKPNFSDQASGTLLRQNDLIELSQLDLSTKNRMAIRGSLQQKAGQLSGRLEVGISPGQIQMSENRALDAMFSDPREGFRWISIKISGTAAAAQDDFSQLYSLALDGLKQRVKGPETSPQSSSGAASFEELTRPR